jgi:hypothetical protein
MKLLDYFNTDYIADLALVENLETHKPIKLILSNRDFASRFAQLNDERLINFIFSNHILMFLDQTISYYFSFGYNNFLKNYHFGSQLLGVRILDAHDRLTPSLSLIYKRIENKPLANNIYNTNNYRKNLEELFKKIVIKKLEESSNVLVSEIEIISKIFNLHDFKQAYISAISLDVHLRHYLNSNNNNQIFSTAFFQSIWMELFKKGMIDRDKLYFLNYIIAKNITFYYDGIPFTEKDICVDNSISENENFLSHYKEFINNKNSNSNYIY